MVMVNVLKLILFCALFTSCKSSFLKVKGSVYKTQTLSIVELAPNVYQHISYLSTQDFGKVSCNGMIVVNNKEAVVFDTPADSAATVELMNWVGQQLQAKIVAVVPTHFHNDCLGGLKEFHAQGIPSYAHNMTIDLARENKVTLPQQGFDVAKEIKVGHTKVSIRYFGEGHTKDNVVAYFADEDIMFGGCLIKEIGATKGYLGDANVRDWAATVLKVKQYYPKVKKVIPGHGEIGDIKLLDYTIKLFKIK